MISALILIALSAEPAYPLAAAFAQNQRIIVATLPDKSTAVFETLGLVPSSAELDRGKTKIVFAARDANGGSSRLFLLEIASGKVIPLNTGIAGDHYSPHFTRDGQEVIFSASDATLGSPQNPTSTRIYRLETMATRATPRIEKESAQCEFSAAPLGNETVHVSTNCWSGFELKAKGIEKASSRTIAALNSPTSEIATSFDARKIVYTSVDNSGTWLFLVVGNSKPREIAHLVGEFGKIQPSFICPRDVMFTQAHEAWVVNSDSGKLTKLAPLAGGRDGGIQ